MEVPLLNGVSGQLNQSAFAYLLKVMVSALHSSIEIQITEAKLTSLIVYECSQQ